MAEQQKQIKGGDMDYESDLQKAYDQFRETLSGTSLLDWYTMLGTHINEMEKAAMNCNFEYIAQHMREIGEESVGLDTAIGSLKKKKTINGRKEDEITDKLVSVWEKLDLFIANELKENCGCRLREVGGWRKDS